MPDWLTHVLVGYVVGSVLAHRSDRLDRRHVTLAMVGALLPDLSKAELVVPAADLSAALGVPIHWSALHTIPATVLVAAGIALLLPPRIRRAGFALLVLGGCTHHALDLLLVQPTGTTYPALWPLSGYRAPSPDLLLSSDREPALVAGTLAAVVAAWRSRAGRAEPAPAAEERPSWAGSDD